MLQNKLYQYFMDCLKKTNPKLLDFIDAFNQAQTTGTPYISSELNLSDWPNLYFTFAGANDEPVTLCCPPDHYWQLNATMPNRAFFTLLKQIPNWPNQSVIGLPLISSYLCIFDRSVGSDGIIKFANKVNHP